MRGVRLARDGEHWDLNQKWGQSRLSPFFPPTAYRESIRNTPRSGIGLESGTESTANHTRIMERLGTGEARLISLGFPPGSALQSAWKTGSDSLADSVVIPAFCRSKIKETNLVAFKRDDDGLAQIKPFG